MKKVVVNFSYTSYAGMCGRLFMKGRFFYILSILFLVLTVSANATVYYVSSSGGNDSNPGTSSAKPWKSLAKANSFSPKPGDQILFKRGDSWEGKIKVNSSGSNGSPIVYGAYGTGEKPKIYGSKKITGWTKHSGNIYKAKINNDVNQIFLNDERLTLARFPNEGYIKIDKMEGSNSFSSSSLEGHVNYAGATWIGRTIAWSLETSKVASSNSKRLTIGSKTLYEINKGEGFILNNKLEFLDSPGEWYYEKSTKTLYLYVPNGVSPNSSVIRGSVIDNAILLERKNFIILENLAFLHFSDVTIVTDYCNNLSFKNNEIYYPDARGIYLNHDSNGDYSNNKIVGANHYGIRANTSNSQFIENTILETGIFDNLGKTGMGDPLAGRALDLFAGKNNLIKHNQIMNTGYVGIGFFAKNTVIDGNYIKNACLVKDDGGAIYTWSADYSNSGAVGSVIKNNIVDNVPGNKEGGILDRSYGYGIYMDGGTRDVIIENNTVAHCSNGCIYLHNSGEIEVRNNTLFDGRYLIYIEGQRGFYTIQENILYAKDKDMHDFTMQKLIGQRHKAKVTSNKNIFINPYNTSRIFRDQDSFHSFSDWKKATKQDSNSTIDNTKLKPEEKEELFYNASKTSKTINLGKSEYRDLEGKKIKGSIVLKPFTSKILIKTKSDNSSSNSSPRIDSQTFNVQGSKQANEYIGKVIASDPNQGQQLTFSIIQGNNSSMFTIDPVSGDISTNSNIDATQDVIVELVVKVVDNDVNPLSATATMTINIKKDEISQAPDNTVPVISSFSIPSTSSSLRVSVSEFTATDNNEIAGYFISESSNVPLAGDAGWSKNAPTSYTFSETGSKILYGWVKDNAGNISGMKETTVVITLPNLSSTYSEYLFEEVSGAVVLDSKGTNDGNIINAVLRIDGVQEKGLDLNGSNYISVGKVLGENVQQEVSISAWIKPNIMEGDYQGVIMHGGPNIDTYALYINPSSKSIGFKTSGTTSAWTSIANIEELWDGNWHHLAATYDGTEKVVYLDGEIIARVEASGYMDSGDGYNLLIGAGRDKTIPELLYNGLIDEVRISNVALTESEIKDQYNFTTDKSGSVVHEEETISICEGGSYEGWTESGVYERTLKTVSGADSIITTHLVVNPLYVVNEDITINEGEEYNGWKVSGEYQRTLNSIHGCDSVVTTNLTVSPLKGDVEYIAICEGGSYEGWTESGVYERTLKTVSGADSTVTTHLTVNPSYLTNEEITITEGEEYLGWTTSGEYERTLTAITGCDSVVTTKLTVSPLKGDVEYITICEGGSYEGWTESGVYERTLKTVSGADSTVTTHLTVNPSYLTNEEITITEGEEYLGWTTSGEYNRTLTAITGCDSVVVTSLVVEKISNPGPNPTPNPNHFIPVWEQENGQNHMNFNIVAAYLDGELLEAGDEIGVFDGEICVGSITLVQSIIPSQSESFVQLLTSENDGTGNGFVEGNKIQIKVWDSSEQVEIVGSRVNFKNDLAEWNTTGTFIPNSTSVLTIGEDDLVEEPQLSSQSIELSKGWNIFSANVRPTTLGMEQIQDNLLKSGQLVKIQCETGNTYENWGSNTGWVNNIGNIDVTRGYKIKVSNDCVLDLTGQQVELPLDLELKKGWNIISVPLGSAVDAMEFIRPLIDSGILQKVQDEKGNSIEYWGDAEGWINRIGNFHPGEGYKLKVNTNTLLSVTGNYNKSAEILAQEEATSFFNVHYEGNGLDHMNINITELNDTKLKAGDEIAVFDNDICVGAVKLIESHFIDGKVSINASFTDENLKNGFIEGNGIDLRIWRAETDSELQQKPEVLSGQYRFERQSSVFVKLNNEDAFGIPGFDSLEMEMYPNPASSTVNIRFSELPDVGTKIILSDMTGKQLIIREVQTTTETIDIESLPDGMYLVNTVTGDNYKVNKLIKK